MEQAHSATTEGSRSRAGKSAPKPVGGLYTPADGELAAGGESDRPTARLRLHPDGERLLLTVESYCSPALAERLGGESGWRETLDSLLIDPDYDGQVFRARLADVPPRGAAVRGRYDLEPPGAGSVAVKLVDVLGDETLVLLAPECASSPGP